MTLCNDLWTSIVCLNILSITRQRDFPWKPRNLHNFFTRIWYHLSSASNFVCQREMKIVRDIKKKKDKCICIVFPKIYRDTKSLNNNAYIFFFLQIAHCFLKQWLNSKYVKYKPKRLLYPESHRTVK